LSFKAADHKCSQQQPEGFVGERMAESAKEKKPWNNKMYG
jgi:hypothetical protein